MFELMHSRFDTLNEQLIRLIQDPQAAQKQLPYSYRYLTSIQGSLLQLQECVLQQPMDTEKCRLYAGGLGRLILDYTDLPESELGKQILWLVSDVLKLIRGK